MPQELVVIFGDLWCAANIPTCPIAPDEGYEIWLVCIQPYHRDGASKWISVDFS